MRARARAPPPPRPCRRAPRLALQVVTPQRQPIHPVDLLLLMNYVNSTASLRVSTNYSPICLPKFRDSGMVYAYIDFIAKTQTVEGEVGVCLILISTSPDPERCAEGGARWRGGGGGAHPGRAVLTPPPPPGPRTTLRKNRPLVPRSNSRITFLTRVVGFSCLWWM